MLSIREIVQEQAKNRQQEEIFPFIFFRRHICGPCMPSVYFLSPVGSLFPLCSQILQERPSASHLHCRAHVVPIHQIEGSLRRPLNIECARIPHFHPILEFLGRLKPRRRPTEVQSQLKLKSAPERGKRVRTCRVLVSRSKCTCGGGR